MKQLRPPFHGVALSDALRLIQALSHPDIVRLALVHARDPDQSDALESDKAPLSAGALVDNSAKHLDAIRQANEQRSMELDKLASDLAERAAQMGQSGLDFYNNVKAERYELDTWRDKLTKREAEMLQREMAVSKRETELSKVTNLSAPADPNL